ncbi:MAG TPA: hypothetical protein VG247_25850 [Pseudonocardiaceae bacterium]|jgi:hypothetical protein|nr:hypothetical protein [Pseudonocardiaceae bacterium]
MWRWVGVVGVAVGIVVAGAGIAVSAIPDPTGVISSCVNNSTGALRVIDPSTGATCTAAETALNFNQQGQQGPQGPQGDPGVNIFARVTSSGTLRAGSGVTSVSHQQAGIYQVTFTQDVTNCAVTATVDGDGGTTDLGFAGVATIWHGGSEPDIPANAVDVVVNNTFRYQGTSFTQDAPFSVIVAC